METLLDGPAFRTYALTSSLLALKMLLSAVWTGTRRQRSQGYVNPEDARVFGQAGVTSMAAEAPEVARALRIQRNDLENIPMFFAVGLLYVLSGASALGAAAYCWTFAIARILHTLAYMNDLQPWRAICWGVGALATLGMLTQVVLRTI